MLHGLICWTMLEWEMSRCLCGLALLDWVLSCRALSSWYNEQQQWKKLVRRVMDQDWSWANPALDYIELYYKALRGWQKAMQQFDLATVCKPINWSILVSNELCISDGSIMTQLYFMVPVPKWLQLVKQSWHVVTRGLCVITCINSSINGRWCYTFARQTNMKHEFWDYVSSPSSNVPAKDVGIHARCMNGRDLRSDFHLN